MSARRAVTPALFLVAAALAWYAVTALVVATAGDGQALSFAAPAAVVLLSYVLARALGALPAGDRARRLWGAVLSVVAFALVLRIDIAGEPYLWRLRWLADLIVDTGGTLEGRSGDVAEVVLLVAAWLWGVRRGSGEITHDGVLAEMSVGLVVVLTAAAFAPAADAPAALRWLPAPYLLASFLTLALVFLPAPEDGAARRFLPYYAATTGGALLAIAGLAAAASFFDPPSLHAAGEVVLLVLHGIVLGVAFALAPFIIAGVWITEQVVRWLPHAADVPPVQPSQPPEQPQPDSGGTGVVDYVLRAGLVAFAVALALVVLWFSFRRLAGARADEDVEREEVVSAVAPSRARLRSLLSGALARLPGRRRPRDAIGRLYLAVLRRSETRGLARPASATPLEFAPALRAHWGSPVVEAISHAYSEARYGRRPPPRDRIDDLRAGWERLVREGG